MAAVTTIQGRTPSQSRPSAVGFARRNSLCARTASPRSVGARLVARRAARPITPERARAGFARAEMVNPARVREVVLGDAFHPSVSVVGVVDARSVDRHRIGAYESGGQDLGRCEVAASEGTGADCCIEGG